MRARSWSRAVALLVGSSACADIVGIDSWSPATSDASSSAGGSPAASSASVGTGGADVCSTGGVCRCDDAVQDGDETGIDCGGSCLPCLGDSCSEAAGCASGHCADGVCCDGACVDACHSCAADETGEPNGTCAALPDGSKDAACPDDGPGSCKTNGACSGGACANYPKGTVCAAASCPPFTFDKYLEKHCDGMGTCDGGQMSCGNYKCGFDNDCFGYCSNDSYCANGTACKGNLCQ